MFRAARLRYAAQCRPARARRLRVVGTRPQGADRATAILTGRALPPCTLSMDGLAGACSPVPRSSRQAARRRQGRSSRRRRRDSDRQQRALCDGTRDQLFGQPRQTLRRQGREIVDRGRRQRQGHRSVRADKTTLIEPLATLPSVAANLTYSMCASSKAIAEAKEQVSIPLISGASLVPFGIGRVVDLQLKGWAYIHA